MFFGPGSRCPFCLLPCCFYQFKIFNKVGEKKRKTAGLFYTGHFSRAADPQVLFRNEKSVIRLLEHVEPLFGRVCESGIVDKKRVRLVFSSSDPSP